MLAITYRNADRAGGRPFGTWQAEERTIARVARRAAVGIRWREGRVRSAKQSFEAAPAAEWAGVESNGNYPTLSGTVYQ